MVLNRGDLDPRGRFWLSRPQECCQHPAGHGTAPRSRTAPSVLSLRTAAPLCSKGLSVRVGGEGAAPSAQPSAGGGMRLAAGASFSVLGTGAEVDYLEQFGASSVSSRRLRGSLSSSASLKRGSF